MGLALIVIALTGCAHQRQFQPAVDPNTLNDTQFVHYLQTVPLVTYEEACRAVVITAEGKDDYPDHASRVGYLEGRDIVRSAWKLEPNDAVDLGTVSFMLAKTCALPPSVNAVVFGSWGLGDRRYALKQAADHQLIPYGPAHRLMTGGEFVSAVGHADDYMARTGRYGPETAARVTSREAAAGP